MAAGGSLFKLARRWVVVRVQACVVDVIPSRFDFAFREDIRYLVQRSFYNWEVRFLLRHRIRLLEDFQLLSCPLL